MRLATRMLVCAVVCLSLAGGTAPVATAADACSLGDTRVSQLSEFGAQFVTICLVNEQRANAGAPPVTYNPRLFLAAYGHATDMVARRYFAHDTPEGDTVVQRVAAQEYAATGDGTGIGEDLAWGNGVNATPRATVRAWLNSAGHRAVMLDPAYREIGIGVHLGAPLADVLSGESATYAAVFGVINHESAQPAAVARRAATRSRARARARAAACRRARRNHRLSARCSRASLQI